MLAVARLAKPLRLRLMSPLAVGASLPLVVCFADPGLVVVILLFVASGVGSAYQVIASTTFVIAVPDSRRGQAFGLAVTALKVSQGLGVTLAGLAAEGAAPYLVVGVAGVLGVLAAAGIARSWRRAGGRDAALVS
jgi:predicted MFS family arabinose efflux permease